MHYISQYSSYTVLLLLLSITLTAHNYENIDKILPNKLHGPMHLKIGVTCVYNGHVFYTLL